MRAEILGMAFLGALICLSLGIFIGRQLTLSDSMAQAYAEQQGRAAWDHLQAQQEIGMK